MLVLDTPPRSPNLVQNSHEDNLSPYDRLNDG